MSLTVTLASLKTQARQRADMENSSFVSDSELLALINNSYAELYDILVQAYGSNYFALETTLTMDQNTQKYALPSDFYKLLGVDLLIDGTYGLATARYVTLDPFEFQERNRFSNIVVSTVAGTYPNYRYRLMGQYLRFIAPQTGDTIVVHYVPRVTLLVNDSDTVDGVNGFEEYIIIDAAIKMAIKEESDVSALMAQKQGIMNRIKMMSAQRDVGRAPKVSDVTRTGMEEMIGNYEW